MIAMTLVNVTRTVQIEGVFGVRYTSVTNIDTTQSLIQSLLFLKIVLGVHVFMLDSMSVSVCHRTSKSAFHITSYPIWTSITIFSNVKARITSIFYKKYRHKHRTWLI
jgi:hypothetical protein